VRALYITIIGVVIFLLVLFTFLYYRTRRSKAALEVLNRKLDMEMAERRQAETDLSVSEFAYRFLADNTPDMIVQLDRMGVVRYVSPSFRAVMGYSPGGSDGDFGILDTIHPDFREEMTRLFVVMVESKKPMLYTYKAIGQTGNIFWVESLANPTFDPSTGEYTGSIAVIRNIEERVKNEEQLARNARQKELLLREIHHRVKNNFAILSGVMTLQQYSADNPELTALVNDLHIRIRSMSLVHELLYKNENLDVIPFDTYLVQLSQVVASGHRNKPVHFNCPLESCTLDIETALPLGLIVTEILTNAFKYAFSETPDNLLTLSLNSSVNDTSVLPYDWKLTVRDNGRGLPEGFDLGNAHTLGSQIVTLLVDQIDGKVEAYNDAGACFNIFFYRHFERTGRLSEDDWLPLPSNGTEGNK
jgi:PAS domain S-box-containing protein